MHAWTDSENIHAVATESEYLREECRKTLLSEGFPSQVQSIRASASRCLPAQSTNEEAEADAKPDQLRGPTAPTGSRAS